MKIYIILLLSSVCLFSQTTQNKDCKPMPFDVFLNDKTEDYSNIRESPNGHIIMKLDNKHDDYVLNVVDCKQEWFKVDKISSLNGFEITYLDAWVHTSIIGAGTTHDLDVFNQPNSKTKIGTLKGEEDTFRVIDIHCDWIQINCKDKHIVGWVESKKICGNPVTTCP